VPRFELRSPEEVPTPKRASKAIQQQQQIYEGFIRQLNNNVGELQLAPDEQVRSIKVRLRRAATRLGAQLEIWDVDGKVYFRAEQRRRPRATRQRAGSRAESA
jgi:hypothetical protein